MSQLHGVRHFSGVETMCKRYDSVHHRTWALRDVFAVCACACVVSAGFAYVAWAGWTITWSPPVSVPPFWRAPSILPLSDTQTAGGSAGEHGTMLGTHHYESRPLDAHTPAERIASRLMLLPRGDGFGTHVVALLSALAYCKRHNLTYVHFPWDNVGHCPPGVPHRDWSASLEEFTGLIAGEVQYSNELGPVPSVQWIRFDAQSIDDYFHSDFLAAARARYLAAQPPKMNSAEFIATKQGLQVAVHVRRGDIQSESNGRYTNNARVLEYMRLAEQEMRARDAASGAKNLTFHIYSEGDAGMFEDLTQAFEGRVFLHLNETMTTSFYDMTSADALIAAKSGLSYAAALLSAGRIYYQAFWLAPLKHWRLLPSN